MTSNTWQRNLAANFLAELLTMTAFTFVDPLLPLYIQKVGDLTTQQAAFWAGIAASGLSIAMFFISPIWGMLADRYGRKPMVLRAMFGGAIILSLIGIAPNIYFVIVLRWLQGLVTGSVAAMTALASSIVPRNRMSFAMGIIMLAVFGGQSIGPLVGGYVADHLGYQAAFYLSGAFLLAGGLTVLLLVKEDFQKPAESSKISLRDMLRPAFSKQMLPLLAIMSLVSIGQSLVGPITSLRVKEVVTDPSRVATTSGLIFSLMGFTAAISSFAFGRLGDKTSLPKIMAFCFFIIGLLYLPPIWATTIGVLATSLILTGLLRGGQATSTNAMIGASVAQSQQGIAYGLGQSASSLGGGVGSLIGGGLAGTIGLKNVFGVSAGVFIISSFLTMRWLSRRSTK
ncbi:MAG: MFS transporter [Chloroflexi bacterium]|nr:MFS transporter [Chloroflexota bacterium]